MVEAAVRTTATTAGIWTIVIVASALLVFWLSAIFLADRSQARASGRSQPGTMANPALGNAWAGGSLAGEQAEEVPGEAVHEPIGAQGRHARQEPAQEEPAPEGDVPTRADLPAQRTGEADRAEQPTQTGQPAQAAQSAEPAGPAGRHAMPAQRSGEADRAERSYTGPLPPDEDETER